MTAAGLRLRAAEPGLFLEGDYLPLDVETTVEGSVVAFARVSSDGGAAIAVAPHLVSRMMRTDDRVPLGDRWRTSRIRLPKALAGLTYRDVFTGAEIRAATAGDDAWLFVGQALRVLPVSLLVGV